MRTATAEKIDEFLIQYLKNYPDVNSEFLTYGIAYIQFAKEYPQLFETIMLPCSTDMDERMMGSLAFLVKSASDRHTKILREARLLVIKYGERYCSQHWNHSGNVWTAFISVMV